MKTILIFACAALFFTACTDSGKPIGVGVTQNETPSTALKPDSEQQGKAFSISTAAFYQGLLNAPSSPGQTISLRLTPEGMAKMTTEDPANSSKTYLDGTWVTTVQGNLMLHLVETGKKDSTMLEFKTDGEKLVYTGTSYGPGGLTLVSKPMPE